MSRAFLILALLASLTPQVRSAEKPVKIYIFAGQSNMEARYPRAFIEEKHPELLADKKIWNVQVGWPSRPIQESPAFGVDRAMVYKIAQETGQEIIVLRCAVGGTVLHTQWRPPSAVKRAGGTVGPLYMSLVTNGITSPSSSTDRANGSTITSTAERCRGTILQLKWMASVRSWSNAPRHGKSTRPTGKWRFALGSKVGSAR